MTEDFFRREVVLHRRRGGVGGIRLVRPLSMTVLTAMVVALALGVGAWLAAGSYTRKIRLDGWLSASADGRASAELFALASLRGSLRIGQIAQLRSPATSAPASGAVVSVSPSPITAAELPALPASVAALAASEALYRVRVRLDVDGRSKELVIAPGAAVSADVQIERRRLLEWLFAPRIRPVEAA